MGFGIGSSKSSSNMGVEIAPNAYLKTGVIKDVVFVDEFFGQKKDRLLEITIKDGEYESKHTIGGDFKKENGQIVDWGDNWIVDILLSSYSSQMTDAQKEELFNAFLNGNMMPIAAFLIDKEIYRIIYVGGVREDDPTKLQYKNYYILSADKNGLTKSFLNRAKSGKIKNYLPDFVRPVNDVKSDTEDDFAI